VVNHLGTFMVEEVDADAKTASLRVLRSGILMKDVEWHTIWPLDDKLRARFKDLFNSEEFQQFLSRRSSRNVPVAVGTILTDRPPHRSVRARLRIRLF